MPVARGGFEQSYNAQAAVAAGILLVVAADVVQAANDKQQLKPMLGKIAALPEALGKAETLLADNGYFSAARTISLGSNLDDPSDFDDAIAWQPEKAGNGGCVPDHEGVDYLLP
jgi:hypothetical protein